MSRHAARATDGIRRILVLTYHFPPDGSVGGLRWSGFSKYLARRGWEVHVVTAAEEAERQGDPGVVVHHCPPRRTLNDRYKSTVVKRRTAKRAAAGPTPPAPAAGVAAPHPIRQPFSWLRRSLGTALAFPDIGRGWILRAGMTARGLLRTHEFAAVISSGPPHSAHLAGLIACGRRRGRLWIDMRDPWSEPAFTRAAHALNRFDGTTYVIRALERIVVRRAGHVIVNTPEFATHTREKYPGAPISVVTNGIDLEGLPPEAANKFDGLSIAYAGTLYFNRNLTPVVRAMQDFVRDHPEARDAVKLRLAGTMEAEHLTRFWSDVDAAGLHGQVEVLGRLPRADALDLINRSHLSLVLAQDQRVQVPAKLYECVAMRVPTLVIAEPSSAAAREGRRIGAIACDPTDLDGIRQLIERLWQHRGAAAPAGGAVGYDVISGTMEALLEGNAGYGR
jgi:glycosyltransferase involved in cell wall biosynthesis